jgi:hypothetical protein
MQNVLLNAMNVIFASRLVYLRQYLIAIGYICA